MNLYERLEDQAHAEGIAIDRSKTLDDVSGMFVTIEGYPPIAHISPDLDLPESASVLAEELGHYYTSSGDCAFYADQQQIDRAEVRALRSAVRDVLQLHPDRIIKLMTDGVSSFNELAERLEISEEFLARARGAWIAEYGTSYRKGRYQLTFEPLRLQVERSRACIRIPVFSSSGLTKWWLAQRVGQAERLHHGD